MYRVASNNERFWANLPWMPEGKELYLHEGTPPPVPRPDAPCALDVRVVPPGRRIPATVCSHAILLDLPGLDHVGHQVLLALRQVRASAMAGGVGERAGR